MPPKYVYQLRVKRKDRQDDKYVEYFFESKVDIEGTDDLVKHLSDGGRIPLDPTTAYQAIIPLIDYKPSATPEELDDLIIQFRAAMQSMNWSYSRSDDSKERELGKTRYAEITRLYNRLYKLMSSSDEAVTLWNECAPNGYKMRN